MKAPKDSSGERIPLYPDSKTINIDQKDIKQLIIDSIGYEYLLYASNTDISWTEDIGNDVLFTFDDILPDDKWRVQSDWFYGQPVALSEWKKGDLELTILVFDNLNSNDLRDLKKEYGIEGLETGSTLILTHVIDITKKLPDETATAENISLAATKTAEILSINNTSTAEAKTAVVVATQSAQETAQAITELEQLLEEHNEDFNSSELADYWEIYRPNPKKWDLTSEPGMLHIVGIPEREAGIMNIFGAKVTEKDVEVTTRIEVDKMSDWGQSAWIAFTPEDYSNYGFTVEIGLSYKGHSSWSSDDYEGYRVYMWEADNQSGHRHNIAHENIDYTGSMYLKLVRKGNDYAGYYSNNGNDWIFLGESNNFSTITDQISFGACCGEEEFDVYFDYIHFAIPE